MQFLTPEQMEGLADWDDDVMQPQSEAEKAEDAETVPPNIDIDSLAVLDFSMPTTQISLPDVGFQNEEQQAEQASPQTPEGLETPQDEDVVIEIAPSHKPIYKRPGPKLAIALGAAILVCGLASQLLSNGVSSVSLTENQEDETAVDINTPETADSEDQINNEGKLKSQIASSNLAQEVEAMNEVAKEGEKNGGETSSTTTSTTSSPTKTPPPPSNRIVYGGSTRSAPSTHSAPSPSLPSRTYRVSSAPQSQVPPSVRSLPVSQSSPSLPSSVVKPPSQTSNSSQVGTRQLSSQPTMGSFGAMPETATQPPSQAPSSIGGYQAVALNPSVSNPPFSGVESSDLLAQQESLFLSGKKQTQIRAGQFVSGKIQNQVLAQEGSIFYVSTTGSLLGLPTGTMFQVMITGTSGRYINAEAIAIVAPDGTQSPLSPGAVSVGTSNGKLLKASTNKGFFNSQFGQALLGAGQGLANEFTSRSETYSQSQFGSTFSREGGKRDLGSLASGAIKGLTDPILSVPSSSETALTLNPGTSVQLAINSSFYFAL